MRPFTPTAVAAGLLQAAPVFAAQPTTPPPVERSDATVLEEVTVTARRREENLQSVPVAVSVVSGDWLDKSATVNTQQLAQLVPSLYYNSANPRNTAYTIRGLGSNTLSVSAANDGIEPGVGFYVDGVYHSRPATAAFDFTDIERVEVLRGPQGTLFGKNTTGGAINIVSRAPSFEPEATAQVSFGNYDFMQAKASFSGGLSDRVAGRLSAQITRRDGLITNVSNDRKLNNLNNVALKGQLLFQASDDLAVRLIVDVSDFDADCCTQSYLRTGNSLRSAARQFAGLSAALPAHGLPAYVPPSTNVFDRLTDIDAPLHVDTQDGGVSLNADWKLGANTLTSITAWRWWDWDVANDRDYIGVPIQLVQRIPSRQDQYSQELRLSSNGEGPLSYVGGLYYFEQTINGKPTSVYGPAAAYWLISTTNFVSADRPDNLADGYGQYGDSHFTMKSYAAFGELNYRILPKLTGTLGLRYTYEDKHGDYATTVSGGLPFSTLPDPVTCTMLTGAVLNGRDNAKLSLFRPQCYSVGDSGGSVSGRANLAWQFTDSVMAYASFAHGYKAGGINMSGLQLTGGTGAGANQPALDTAVIGDEKNSTFELGLKSVLFQGRVTANLAAYKSIVKDFQANIATPVTANNAAPLRTFPANIPEVQVKGFEADLAAVIFHGFTLRASLAYADGIYTDYPAGPCPLEWQNPNATGGCQPLVPPATLANQTVNPRGNPTVPGAYVLTGLPLSGLSKWVGTLGFDYATQAGSGEAYLHADWNVRSGYNADTTNSRFTWLNGYGLVNASVGYRFSTGWEAELFARNLLDNDYVTALTIQTGNSGLILGQTGEPRLVGVGLRARF
ncbi:MAG: TonB-dependent receptor [Pseudomonadota bacterium]